MVDDDSPITGHTTAIRRVKYVSSHELRPDEIQVRPPELEVQVYLPNPAMEELIDPDAAPAVDPTEIGLRRPRRLRIRYRLAQLAALGALAASAAAVIAVALSDRKLANIISIIAVCAGLLAVYLSMRSRMASRIMGYAIAVAALSALTAAIVLTLPKHWFEERHPEELPQAVEVRPKPQS
jgi:hypothetical protein